MKFPANLKTNYQVQNFRGTPISSQEQSWEARWAGYLVGWCRTHINVVKRVEILVIEQRSANMTRSIMQLYEVEA